MADFIIFILPFIFLALFILFVAFAAIGSAAAYIFRTMGYFYARQTYHMLFRIGDGNTANIYADLTAVVDSSEKYFGERGLLKTAFCSGVSQYIDELRELNLRVAKASRQSGAH